ncbi:MAG: sulfotransferase domain-containing protein, partial [bacterium]
VEQGRYATHLSRYLRRFPRSQLLVLIYEDALDDPAGFIGRIYSYLGVDPAFRSIMLAARVGEGRIPRSVVLERALTRGTWALRGRLTRGLWWAAKRAGVGRALRRANTANVTRPVLPPVERGRLAEMFSEEIGALERLLDRDLTAWRQ